MKQKKFYILHKSSWDHHVGRAGGCWNRRLDERASERASVFRIRFYALAMLKSDFGKLTAAMAPWNCKLTSIPSR